MDNETLRNVVADALEPKHSNTEFIRQMRSGEQDDGPFMMAAFAVRDAYAAMLRPAPEVVEE